MGVELAELSDELFECFEFGDEECHDELKRSEKTSNEKNAT